MLDVGTCVSGDLLRTMFSLKSPRLEKTPLFHPAFSVPHGRTTGRRLCVTHKVEVRVRRRLALKALEADLLLPEPNLEVVLTSAPETSTVAVVAIVAAGLIAVVAIGVGSQLGTKGRVTSLSPSKLQALLAEKNTLLVDIRNKAEIKAQGNPSLRGFPARTRALSYTTQSREGQIQAVEKYGESFAKMKGVTADSVVVLLDAGGRQAASAAKEILNFNDFSAIYYVSGGATALEATGIAWKKAPEGISLSLPSVPKVDLKGLDLDKIAETYKDRPTLFNTGLALGALVTAGVILFQEFDIILEAVGVLGGANILFKRFFFAEDREKTINELRSLFNDKIVASEAGDDLKRLASTILEVTDPREDPLPVAPPSPAPDNQVAAVGEAQA